MAWALLTQIESAIESWKRYQLCVMVAGASSHNAHPVGEVVA